MKFGDKSQKSRHLRPGIIFVMKIPAPETLSSGVLPNVPVSVDEHLSTIYRQDCRLVAATAFLGCTTSTGAFQAFKDGSDATLTLSRL